jgi:putative uncharacterized protein jpn03
MGKLTLDSTFDDIRKLIEEKDKIFALTVKSMAEHKKENIKNAFFFLMAMALGGVDDKEPYGKKFLELVDCNEEDWSKNAKKFVIPDPDEGEEKLREDYNKLLKELENTTLSDVAKLEVKNKTERYIEYKEKKIKINVGDNIFEINGKNWYFDDIKSAKDDLKKAIDNLIKLYEREEREERTPQYHLLLSNKQLIMNGAPGTGKTYLARNDIADLLLFNLGESEDVDKKNLRLGMVQFHPSYDYTDFIDGIRPDLSGKSLKYTLKNGSFKSFCRRAGVIERILATKEKVNEQNIDKFLKGEDNDIIEYWKDEINKGAKKEFNVSKLPKFLFIIDEINRAEVSKVLGEVMYCLDPDYRGSDGAISTQYSSLATDETFFISKENDKFFIPSNVYIIGTMNDIDRSVEVFDFALRRRFAWYEIKADDVMDSVLRSMNIDSELGDNNYKKYKEKIKILNEAIIKSLGLNEHYCIGPSYFAKIKLYLDDKGNYADAKEKVWDNHIQQILNEYVKGKRKETEIVKIHENFITEFDSNDKKES